MKTSFKLSRRNQQRGLSIIGALLALVIGALLLIPVVNAFLDSQRKTRIEDNAQEIRTIIADLQKVYGVNNQYAGATTATAVQGAIIPARLRVAGTTTANNSYNGAITVAPATITVANDAVTLTWSAVNQADCADLLFSINPLTRRLQVGATVVKPNDGVINAATVATSCDAAAPVALAFTIGRKG